MGKFVIAAFICLTIAFISCKKDRDKSYLVNGIDITGTWKEIYFETYNWSGGVGSVSFDTMQLPCLTKNTFTINADGTASTIYVGTDTCTWYHAGNMTVQVGDPRQPPINYTWTQSADTLSFHYHTDPNQIQFQSYVLKSGITNQLILVNSSALGKWVK